MVNYTTGNIKISKLYLKEKLDNHKSSQNAVFICYIDISKDGNSVEFSKTNPK